MADLKTTNEDTFPSYYSSPYQQYPLQSMQNYTYMTQPQYGSPTYNQSYGYSMNQNQYQQPRTYPMHQGYSSILPPILPISTAQFSPIRSSNASKSIMPSSQSQSPPRISNSPVSASSTEITNADPEIPQEQLQAIVPSTGSGAVSPHRESGGGVGPRFVDITEYLNLPQNIAAQKLNIPTSTLSKRWKAAVSSNRKWPFRVVSKLDKEITTLLYNLPKDVNEQDMTYETKVLKQKLGVLMQERQDHLKPVVILLP